MSTRPDDAILADCRVLDLSQAMAGPLAAMVLADHGADVIKVEPPGGDRARSERGFHMWNRAKRSIVLDLEREADRHTALDLARWADVTISDGAPGGSGAVTPVLTEDDLLAVNPTGIHCTIDTWGPAAGPDRRGPLGDAALSAATGRMAALDRLSGGLAEPRRTWPTFTVPPVASYGAAMLATQGVLAAWLARDLGAPGQGATVHTSLLQGAMTFMMREPLDRCDPTEPDAPVGDDLVQRGIELCFLTAECGDGRYIQMCARQDHHFRSWLQALEIEALLDQPRFAAAPLGIASVDDIVELEALLRARMLTRTQAEWMRTFTDEFDIGADPFLTPEEFLGHEQMVANGRLVELDDPVLGPVTQVGSLVVIGGGASTIGAPAPMLDQHADELRALACSVAGAAPPPGASADAPTSDATARPAGVGPLAGITVLEAAYFVAGPLATTLLAELGARVIKIEPMAGDPYRRTGKQSTKFLHGKESIALDLKSPDGRAILDDLVVRADVLVHSFRLGVPERLGLDHARLHGLNDQLVHLNAASYGSAGAQGGRIAFHSTPTALSGAGILQAGVGNPPVDDSFPDPAAGVGAATAILLGLVARQHRGRGDHLETTMLTSTGYAMSGDLVMSDGGTRARSADHDQLGLGALHRLYRCREGWLFLDAGTGDAWQAAVDELGIDPPPPAGFDPGDEPVDGPLASAVAEALGRDDAGVWAGRLQGRGVAAVVVEDRPFDRWLGTEGILNAADHPDYGEYWRLPPKVTVSPAGVPQGPPTAIGEHTDTLLAELGRSPEEIEQLRLIGSVR